MNQEDIMQKIIKLEAEYENQKTDIKTLYKKIESLDEKYNASNVSIEKILQIVSQQSKDIEEIKDGLNEINKVPAKRWDLIVTSCITGIVGVIIGYVAIRLGLQ